MTHKSFLENYCSEEEFIDKRKTFEDDPIDVIIPLINTNPLFENNLYSFYREIPINRLIIGDGGCTDDSIKILNKFPRVEVFNQSTHRSLGYCIAELISLVTTEWFVYLHSDVYLPENWYETMKKHRKKYDWFECDRRMLVLLELKMPSLKNTERAFSGSQMGRIKAFENITTKIDDDYLQRNEDIIFHELILNEGFKYGRIFDTFHYHQIMNKKGGREPILENFSYRRAHDKEWEIKVYTMQAKGIIKYLKPKPYLVKNVNNAITRLVELNVIEIDEFKKWIYNTNKIWLKYIKTEESTFTKIKKMFLNIINSINSKINLT